MCKDPIKHLEEFQKNQKWYWAHLEEILKDYRDMFVAVAGELVIDSDEDIAKLRDKVESKGVDISSVYVEYATDKPLNLIL
ncbi:MAG: DUF5678 domain-containing protein [Candidatus Hydrogenedentota bacterium]